MPKKQRPASETATAADVSSKAAAGKAAAFHVLIVDADARIADALQREDRTTAKGTFEVAHARSLAEARKRLAAGGVDVALIDSNLPDGSGLDLADELSRSRRITQTIVVSEKESADAAIRALRVGACDYLVKNADAREVGDRVKAALLKQERAKGHAEQVRRLKRLCKKLNKARAEVSQQVDILCNDLVTAYQELAQQMQQVTQSSEFGVVIRDELDLEKLLRRTLEFIVEKAGATNAAMFLPSSMDEYSLGGYVNYDCSSKGADMLLQHLADVVAPKIAECTELVHLTNNDDLKEWIGEDAAWLEDSHVIAFACRHKDEALAIVTLFRDGGQPFSPAMIETCKAIAPMLGENLARIIRIHHRAAEIQFGDDDALQM